MAETEEAGVMSLTVTLLTAYFANNTVPSGDLPALVAGTRSALLGDASTTIPTAVTGPAPAAVEASPVVDVAPEAPVAAPEHVPAVSIEESLASPDQILSLIDGKPYKALKRHLSTHGLTPAEYRARYNLAADYPLVAPSYSAARREVAMKLGLGGKRKAATAEPEASEAPPVVGADEPVVATPDKPARRIRTSAEPKTSKPVAKKSARKATVSQAPAESAEPVAKPKPKPKRASKAPEQEEASAAATPDQLATAE